MWSAKVSEAWLSAAVTSSWFFRASSCHEGRRPEGYPDTHALWCECGRALFRTRAKHNRKAVQKIKEPRAYRSQGVDACLIVATGGCSRLL